MKKKFGFTLAEVLVTLMIIGVIAAVTIPGLRKSADEKEKIVALKKAYSTVANATGKLQTEYGPIKYWNWNDPATIMDEMFVPEFNIVKNCKNGGGCFDPSYQLKSLNGAPNNNFQSDGSWYTFSVADGSIWALALSPGCLYKEGEPPYIKNACGYIEVDINGIKKPNQVGYDVFGFAITKEGAFPFGGCPGCEDTACKQGEGTGWACTAKLLKTEKFTW